MITHCGLNVLTTCLKSSNALIQFCHKYINREQHSCCITSGTQNRNQLANHKHSILCFIHL